MSSNSIRRGSEDHWTLYPSRLDAVRDSIEARRGAAAPDLRTLPTVHLITHIVEQHHGYLRRTLPFIEALAAKVSRVHGEREPRLGDLHAAVAELAAQLLPHLDQEEASLFPSLLAPVRAADAVEATLREVFDEHQAIGAVLARIRDVTDDFQPPAWACKSYRTLLQELAHLEADTFQHVHIENHVLMPRYLATATATA
jgi:regulator of cell morphogenesis and NO signaling